VRLAAIVVPLALFLSMAAASQTPAPSSSPSDIELKVKTRGEQTTFRIGEVIPFELSFVSSAPDKLEKMRAEWWLGFRWIQQSAIGGFRTEVYGFCCGYLSRSPTANRAGFLNAHGMSQWGRRAYAGAEGTAVLPAGWRLIKIYPSGRVACERLMAHA
jgi:hypothetical protein